MELSPDERVFWEYGFIHINLTLVTTWVLMAVLVIVSYLITRRLRTDIRISRWQCILEMLVLGMNKQIQEIGLEEPKKYLDFIGTIFIFIAFSNLSIVFPGYVPPTSSLSTTAALAISVFLAVPIFGISESGVIGYLKTYVQPTFIMLPFNIISELSRTLALAVRLFGNIMSGGLIVAILLSIAPLLFPILMTVLGLITGLIQAYIFSILATVYIAAATQESKSKKIKLKPKN
ncbi:MAG: F0F1 ATP synthase subunit A [Cyclobacteriaceae bacterium]|uniref:F0F1 ATP synthase subunit A n=1 Tax=Algoriphagus sp. TaxID=1872435 RepID=UPI00179F7854|nr:F0F1 ATP synthase subunit A [Algoriphagus sp.]NVJ85088.1 F0F1 ATP synthase subunit A [Algoriphagus sp.]NVK50666.1 F0F1 ATP synthase subunit A [Cyclobacteriaceae bacterium]